jgi:exosortase A-associated hydrolase 1
MSQAFSERVLNFRCQGESLLGVVSAPATATLGADLAVIIVVGGPQYRAGSHRLFVRVARALAGSGITTLRFDYRGMGDSSGAARDFLAVTPDIKAAIDALLEAQPQLKRVVLWGLCDGASASLLYVDETQDARVCGLVLLNPWVRSPESLARTQVKHYYWQRLKQAEFWRKLLSGQLGIQVLRGFGENLRLASKRQAPAAVGFQARMARAWGGFKAPILLLLSGDDYTAKEFIEHCVSAADWRGLLQDARVTQVQIDAADHTFSTPFGADQALVLSKQWLLQHCGTTLPKVAIPR